MRRWLAIAALASFGGILVALGATRLMPGGDREPVRAAPLPADLQGYVGDDVCRRCHPSEFSSHLAAIHRTSLRAATRAALGALCPPPGKINRSQYAFVERGDRLFFEVSPPGDPAKHQLWPLDYAFGAGSKGISFVSMLEGRNVVEMKMSYFPHERVWRITPGQRMEDPAAAGNLGNLDQSRHCLGCHSDAVSRSEFVPRPQFMGVGCESCHGPGRAHALPSTGVAASRMADLGSLSALRLNTLCGKCHQTAKDVAASPLLAKMTYRFQPYGLMLSRCFRESGGRLSCLDCHGPHQEPAPDPRSFQRACLTCHAAGRAAAQPTSEGKPCPVASRAGCIGCHMPQRDVLSAMNRVSGETMTEHRIAVYPVAAGDLINPRK